MFADTIVTDAEPGPEPAPDPAQPLPQPLTEPAAATADGPSAPAGRPLSDGSGSARAPVAAEASRAIWTPIARPAAGAGASAAVPLASTAPPAPRTEPERLAAAVQAARGGAVAPGLSAAEAMPAAGLRPPAQAAAPGDASPEDSAAALPAPPAPPEPRQTAPLQPATAALAVPAKAPAQASPPTPAQAPPAHRPQTHPQTAQNTAAQPTPDTQPPPVRRAPRSAALLAMQALALRRERLAPAATAVADELARHLRCQRVSIGAIAQGRLRVVAMSHTADVQVRQRLVRLIGAAMEEAVMQRAEVRHPPPPEARALASRAHAAVAELNGRVPMLTLPLYELREGDEAPKPFGALLLERVAGIDDDLIAAAQDVATFVGPILALKHRLDQPVAGRLMEAVKPGSAGPWGLRRGHWVALALVVAFGLAAVWPVKHRISAPARIEGQGQQIVAAPFDGFVREAPMRPGSSIKEGDVLLALDDRDLGMELARGLAEEAQLDKAYREAQTTDDAAQVVLARARLEQAHAQLAQVRQKIERSRLRAPFDGVLLAGDFTQQIGLPVKRGDALMTVAPDRNWRVVAEVDEQDITRIQERQNGRLLIGALDGESVQLVITRVAPVASVVDGRNVFEVDAELARPPEALRPGLRGVVRIDVGQRLQGWIWWHELNQWWRRLRWRLWG